MENFTISRNGRNKFTLTENDFIFNCEQLILQISDKLGTEPYSLPRTVDDVDFMQLNEVDELLENHFAYKFIAREYGLNISERMHLIENYISDLLKIAFLGKH